MVFLQTERLVIRDHVPDDLMSMHALLSNADAMYYLTDIRTDSLAGSQQNLAAALAENDNPIRTKYFFAIVDKQSGRYVGEVGYTVTLRTEQGSLAGLGYFILPEWWRRGITTEAAGAVLRYAFETGGVAKMETGCIKDNKASEAVMRKLGMNKEADFRRHVWHDGCWKDRVEYGMTREEWEERNTAKL